MSQVDSLTQLVKQLMGEMKFNQQKTTHNSFLNQRHELNEEEIWKKASRNTN